MDAFGPVVQERTEFMPRLQRVVLALVLGLLVTASVVLLFNRRDTPSFVIVPSTVEATIAVQIGGAVATPGVVNLPAGARMIDAIDAAGGLSAAADVSQLNLAARLADAQRLDIPRLTPSPEATRVSSSTPTDPSTELTDPGDTRINVNTAEVVELETLPGIGPVLAARIIAYRGEHGPFQTVDDLDAVQGISATMVEELRPLVTVDG
ncbi:MAG: ComEA family DNA-binding protein [Chloroflexia bacterium]|nr:ComEA family DNA-binding protein [Chloroflexia bacterium]